MAWTLALIVFVVQLLCCIHVEGKLKKYLPTWITAAILGCTLLVGGFGIVSAVLLWAEMKVLLTCALAIGIYKLVLWTKQ